MRPSCGRLNHDGILFVRNATSAEKRRQGLRVSNLLIVQWVRQIRETVQKHNSTQNLFLRQLISSSIIWGHCFWLVVASQSYCAPSQHPVVFLVHLPLCNRSTGSSVEGLHTSLHLHVHCPSSFSKHLPRLFSVRDLLHFLWQVRHFNSSSYPRIRYFVCSGHYRHPPQHLHFGHIHSFLIQLLDWCNLNAIHHGWSYYCLVDFSFQSHWLSPVT